jgi:transcription elongation factor Elf1
MPPEKEYLIITKIVETLAGFQEGLSKRQVALKVGGGYSTIFRYLDLLIEYGFVFQEDVRTKRGNRPIVKVHLDLLGLLYIIYRISQKNFDVKSSGWVFKAAYSKLLDFLKREEDNLRDLLEDDAWNKLCFLALPKIVEGVGSGIACAIMEEISRRVFRSYLGPKGILDLHYLSGIVRDKASLCELILEGIKEAYGSFFLFRRVSPKDLEAYLDTFSQAFESLSEDEMMDVMAAFRHKYNTLLKSFLKKLPSEIRNDVEGALRRANLNQIVCIFKCPKCGYLGPSIQDLEKILKTYSVKCVKCGSETSMAYLPTHFDEEIGKDFDEWMKAYMSEHVRAPISRLDID